MEIIAVPKPLRDKLGDEASDSLIELINLANRKTTEDVITLSGEKYERRLTEEVAKLDNRITEVEARLDKRITEEVAKLDNRITEVEARLDKRITEVHADIIKWMFIFWAGQIIVIVAIMSLFFKLFTSL
ncbi:MAG: hypothetical protein AB1742_10425 [bacterium]